MSESPSSVRAGADALRREFDRSFARPADIAREEVEAFLAIRIARAPYALRASEIRSLHTDVRWTPAPGRRPGFLGLAGIRGEVVPVFSLAALLGSAPSDAQPRWLVLCGAASLFGLAFDGFDGFRKVPRTSVSPAPPERSGRAVQEAVILDDGARPVIRIGTVLGSATPLPSSSSES